jgi:hypothetical protein
MESSRKYRELAAKLGQELWLAESIDDCRDAERRAEACEELAAKLEELQPKASE